MTSGSSPTATASISCSDHSKGASCWRAVIRMASSSNGRPTGDSQRAFIPVPAPRIAAAAADGPPAGSGAAVASRLRDSALTSGGSASACAAGAPDAGAPAAGTALSAKDVTVKQTTAADTRTNGGLVNLRIGRLSP